VVGGALELRSAEVQRRHHREPVLDSAAQSQLGGVCREQKKEGRPRQEERLPRSDKRPKTNRSRIMVDISIRSEWRQRLAEGQWRAVGG